ncbi:fatty acid-binding protein DegV [Paenibacillus baekrokdamisoli]|uniref:Fatty acid-binding protein DegV n=1 Tax=Paenibacillus baekrokdamisoli TaxID=1712516 RepID=A0A3G9IL58_9BACL|nr:DegV family protein [Paenibacillus baekrokdamisoli]MBB3067151.1 DegV family protein with EDD domain [Paenibacillus baekrokdamisoli]BBH19657.1 fatty acid-binding protein DegV [Paenibacillus baekrokdamisoli]
MSQVKIVTDSTSDIPKRVREQLDIEMVPLQVIFGEETYLDAKTISASQFYEKLMASTTLPTTSQPSPAEFEETYQRILQKNPGSPIISIHISSAISGTYQSAVLGSTLLEEPSERDITVIDSKSASYGAGMLVVKAAEMAAAGESKEAILKEIDRISKDQRLYFFVDSLEYLQKGGRIGKAAALFGSILNIKPILSLDEAGTVIVIDKVRGTNKAMSRFIELFKHDFGNDPVEMTVAWSFKSEVALELAALAQTQLNVRNIRQTEIGAVIGTHVGPGTAALFISRV